MPKKEDKSNIEYVKDYFGDFRKNPEKYKIGKGEQGVLIAEPYKSEIGQYWRFKTPEIAEKSAAKIYQMFLDYLTSDDFIGADMARKYLQMGFTRSRRYANHPSGKKYDQAGNIIEQNPDHLTCKKAESACIFYRYYDKARNNPKYIEMRTNWANK